MTVVFDEPIRLLTDDLAHLHGQLELLILLITHDPSTDTMQRVHGEMSRALLALFIDDVARALGEDE